MTIKDDMDDPSAPRLPFVVARTGQLFDSARLAQVDVVDDFVNRDGAGNDAAHAAEGRKCWGWATFPLHPVHLTQIEGVNVFKREDLIECRA